MSIHLITPIAVLIIHLIIIIVLLVSIIKLLKRIFKSPGDLHLYHSRLITIGLIAILFNKTLAYLILKPFSILINNTVDLTNGIVDIAAPATKDQQLISLSIKPFGNSFSVFFEFFPLAKLLLAISLGIIVYNLIVHLFKQTQSNTALPQTAMPSNALFYNLIILFVLGFSLFLVVSVFISIPYLNEIKKPPLYTKNSLDTALNAIRLSDSGSLKKQFESTPFNISSISVKVFKDSVTTKKNYDTIRVGVKKGIDANISFVDEEIKSVEGQRKAIITKITNAIEEYGRGKKSYLETLKRDYETALQSIIIDKDLMYSRSVNAYSDYIRAVNYNISQALVNLSEDDAFNEGEMNRVATRLSNNINKHAANKDTVWEASIHPQFKYYSSYLSGVSEYETRILPNRRDGSEWGFFGLIAQYLLKAQSLELVLLVGMLGFGLLGASFSSFQNMSSQNEEVKKLGFLEMFKTVPIVTNFWGVLIRGFLAAILIYLATKGGIAILTGDIKADPNGYVLLFLCFLGAVFSEKVWLQAKTKYGL